MVPKESSDWIAERIRKLQLPQDESGDVKLPGSLKHDFRVQLQNVAMKIKELNKVRYNL